MIINCYKCKDTGFIIITEERDSSEYECYYLCVCGQAVGYGHILKSIKEIPFWEAVVKNEEAKNRRMIQDYGKEILERMQKKIDDEKPMRRDAQSMVERIIYDNYMKNIQLQRD